MTGRQKRGILWCLAGTILAIFGLGMLGAAIALAHGGDCILIFLAVCRIAQAVNKTGDAIGWKPR